MATGSSPPAHPRLSESKGAREPPPCRSVKASSTGPWVRREAYNSLIVGRARKGRLLQEVRDVEVVVVELHGRTLRLLPGGDPDDLTLGLVVGGLGSVVLRRQGLGCLQRLLLGLLRL